MIRHGITNKLMNKSVIKPIPRLAAHWRNLLRISFAAKPVIVKVLVHQPCIKSNANPKLCSTTSKTVCVCVCVYVCVCECVCV